MTDLLKTPVQVRSMVDAAFERLETAIMTGELPAGTKLSEQMLADAFGISRAPLREAIRRLEGRKLVERTPYVGVRVVDIAPKDIIQIAIVREALEGMAARLAAELITDDELQDLRRSMDPHGASGKESADSFQRKPDLDFHYRIAVASRNDRLIDLLCGDLYYLLRIYRYRSTQQPGRLKQGLKEHRAIYEALAAHDPDAAEAAMRSHLKNSRLSLMQALQGEPGPVADQGRRAARPASQKGAVSAIDRRVAVKSQAVVRARRSM